MVTAIVGINWGDEGKGRMVDLLSADYDIVVPLSGRQQRGAHRRQRQGQVRPEPAALRHPARRRPSTSWATAWSSIMEHLVGEIDAPRAKRASHITPDNLKISDKAIICMPYHKHAWTCLEEDRLGDAKFGSTRRGIAPVYADKYMKKGIRMGDLLMDPAALEKKVAGIVEWKNLTVHDGYHADAIRTGGHARLAQDLRRPVKALHLRHDRLPVRRHRARARASCSRHSSARCATSTSASIPTPPPPPPSRPMPRSARASPSRSWTRSSAS